MKRENLGINKEDTSDGIDLKPVSDISNNRILTKEAAFAKPFHIQNLTAPKYKHIHIKGYVDFYGGYAEHSRQILTRMHDTGNYNIKLTPIRTPIDVDPFVWSRMNTFIYNPSFQIDKSDFLCIAGPGHFQKNLLPNNRKIIGWTMLETLEISEEIKIWLSNCDEVWCPTNNDMRRCNGVNAELIKVHLGYDPEIFNVNVQPLDIPELRGKFVFGVFGSWNRRKGIKEIVQAYCKAFKENNDVALFLFCKYGTRPYEDCVYGRAKEDKEKWCINWELDKYLEEIDMDRKNAPLITLLDIPIHDNVVPHILAKMHCVVGFSRGESTWFPGLQAMAMGKFVIQLASDCGGYMEYMNDHNSLLCKKVEYVDCIEEDYLGTSEYYEGGKFAQGDIEELEFIMKSIYEYSSMYGNNIFRNIKQKAIESVKEWTWDKTMINVNKLLLEN